MNRLYAMKEGSCVAECMIETGASFWNARRVPKKFVRDAEGADIFVSTSKGEEPRRIVLRNGNYYTRVANHG